MLKLFKIAKKGKTMPFFTTNVDFLDNPIFDKTSSIQPTIAAKLENDYTLLVDTERMQRALDSGVVKMPNEIQGKNQIHEFLLNAGKKQHGV